MSPLEIVAPTYLAEVGSTNDWLLARAVELPDGHWVIADRQTAGRGRRGRVWNDGAGNLMTSVLVRSEGAVQQLSFVAAVALREAIVASVGDAPIQLALKWPNDLLLDGAKLSGILLERAGDALVIGFGVNLASAPEGAAALPGVAPGALQAALANSFAAWRQRWAAEGFGPVRTAWLAHAAGIGQRLVARLGDASLEGCFEDLATDGALVLALDDGGRRAIHAGEVFAL